MYYISFNDISYMFITQPTPTPLPTPLPPKGINLLSGGIRVRSYIVSPAAKGVSTYIRFGKILVQCFFNEFSRFIVNGIKY